MAAHGEAQLPPMPGDAQLTLSLYIPLDALRSQPDIVVRMNGAIIDSFRASRSLMKREIVVHPRADAPNVLVIDTNRVVAPAAEHLGGDARTLGLRLNSIGWLPAQ
jgi:hypothetical protein